MVRRTSTGLMGVILAASAIATSSRDARAQNIDKFVVTGESAKRALSKASISLETAEKVSNACLDYAKEHKLVVSIYILNQFGIVVNVHSMDGLGPWIVDTALKRAQTALYWRASTHGLYNQGEGVGDLGRMMRLYELGSWPATGGLPIIVDNEIIGAIGVSGAGDPNEDCAYYALTKVVGPQPPLPKKLAPPKTFAPHWVGGIVGPGG